VGFVSAYLNVEGVEEFLTILVNHELTSESTRSKPQPSQSPPTSCSLVPCIFTCHYESSNDIFKMHV